MMGCFEVEYNVYQLLSESSGALRTHHRDVHHSTLKRQYLEENTEILTTHQDHRRLPILEALYIKELSPTLNIQASDLQALPSMRRTSPLVSETPTDDVTHLSANGSGASI
ncbi:hypothetical protein Pcinc_009631 [Petrolisthes cinctipes]|uniref:Uncharacterized protein n=1 Tax=Petrolisthes cinctipes TaxID=88211 RepID=A0AAE1G4L6_PETCI|nr:hypothetical protein Pcinc_009631 [Petrolisthes cinctipes]